MEREKQYYKRLDIIRVVACVIVLLYHLNIVKGGFLAVCTFFVMTGYLSLMSAYRKEKFSLKDYYVSRLKNIYVPLAIVVYVSIIIFSLMPNVGWLQLKPESLSALLGYNNFWQLSSNANYFTKQLSSPFMHFWYIAVLLQFDLVFPIFFLLLRKIGEKTKKWVPTVIIALATLGTTGYFYYASITQELMPVYYHTFTRIYSILWGCLIASLHYHEKKKIWEKGNALVFVIYLGIVSGFFIFFDASSPYWAWAMIGITILSCRLIDYSIIPSTKLSLIDKMIRQLASISYEVFLVQCPIIFLLQKIQFQHPLKLVIMIALTLAISFLIHLMIHYHGKGKGMGYLFKTVLVGIVILGNYYLIPAKDYTEEIKELEAQMEQNTALIAAKNQENASKAIAEQEEWAKALSNLENDEEQVKEMLKEIPIVGIGDSVMLGAVTNLYELFPNGYFDAKVSRSIYGVNSIVEGLKSQGKLGNPVIFNLGANGEGSKSTRDQVMQTVGEDKAVFWLTVTNDKDVHVNGSIKNYPNQYANMHVIDWETISKGHSDYFYADGIHLTPAGRKAYANAIYQAVYDYYLAEYQVKKAEIIRQHEEELRNRIAFYGNDVLIYHFDYLQEDYENAIFNINKDYTYELVKADLEAKKVENTLERRIVLAFDTSASLTKEEYEELIKICEGSEVYLLLMNEMTIDNSIENVTIIPFYQEIRQNEGYLLRDRVHLSLEGNLALQKALQETLQITNAD